MRKFNYVVYKITFPNGKIYVGQDRSQDGHSIRYFGSWDPALVEADFSKEELRDFTIRREILFESSDVSEIYRVESDFIVKLHASDPTVGYNQTHRSNRKVGRTN